ncbi:CopG family antitoxin [Syntrophomonas wolfei]|uniref:CopG family antitoxin n=1 Tax=Syntrophomonas wolfei TaxID=863 RepID=UPI0023F4B680|nr:CopG family antitoxin [Syntrophomonas wolfei]
MRVNRFEWDSINIEHIARHGVVPEEVEEVFIGRHLVKKLRMGRYLVLGQSEEGRCLFVIYDVKENRIRIAIARDMEDKERRLYRREGGLKMKKKLPAFKSENEETLFLENNSVADYWDTLEDGEQIELSPELAARIKKRSQLRMISLRLREDQIEAAKKIARVRDIPYQVLLRSWITQAIKTEESKHTSPSR